MSKYWLNTNTSKCCNKSHAVSTLS